MGRKSGLGGVFRGLEMCWATAASEVPARSPPAPAGVKGCEMKLLLVTQVFAHGIGFGGGWRGTF